jgi:hypothetical protein
MLTLRSSTGSRDDQVLHILVRQLRGQDLRRYCRCLPRQYGKHGSLEPLSHSYRNDPSLLFILQCFAQPSHVSPSYLPLSSYFKRKYSTNPRKCGNWQDGFSYCVEANGAPTSTQSTITSPSSTKSATSTSTAQPTWTALGCYLDSSKPPTLSNRTSIVGGDTAMTIEACETACYISGFLYAGVEAGSQCWCSSYVANELAANATDCKTPCAGKASQICGGTGRVNIYQGVLPVISASNISTSTVTSSSTATSKTSSSPTATGTHRLLRGFLWGIIVITLWR